MYEYHSVFALLVVAASYALHALNAVLVFHTPYLSFAPRTCLSQPNFVFHATLVLESQHVYHAIPVSQTLHALHSISCTIRNPRLSPTDVHHVLWIEPMQCTLLGVSSVLSLGSVLPKSDSANFSTQHNDTPDIGNQPAYNNRKRLQNVLQSR